jgi:hypothetical protein
MIFVPYAAPSTGAFVENSPPGVRQKRGAQEASGNRVAFSLVTFFSTARMQEVEQCRSNCRGEAKESNSPSGARTRLKINRRGSDTLIKNVNAV